MILFIYDITYDITTAIAVYELVVKLVHITTVNLFCICYSKFASFIDVGIGNQQTNKQLIYFMLKSKNKKEKNKKRREKECIRFIEKYEILRKKLIIIKKYVITYLKSIYITIWFEFFIEKFDCILFIKIIYFFNININIFIIKIWKITIQEYSKFKK